MATWSLYCAELESAGSDKEVYSGQEIQNLREHLKENGEDSSSGTFCFQASAHCYIFASEYSDIDDDVSDSSNMQ